MYYSADWGITWSLLRDYVYEAEWTDNNSVYMISVDLELQVGDQFSIIDTWYKLYRVSTSGETLFTSDNGIIEFTSQHGLLYAVQTVNSTLSLLVSGNQGDDFQQALFSNTSGFPSDVASYTFVDNSEGVTFIHVNRESSVHYGTLYEADSSNSEYWVSLRGSRVSPGTHQIDFQSVQGLNGIYIANQYNSSIVIDDTEQYINSVISFNKGGVWKTIPVPSTSLCSSHVSFKKQTNKQTNKQRMYFM